MRLAVLLLAVTATLALVPAADASNTPAQTAALCDSLFGSTFGAPSSEPLASCQWDMSLIGATSSSAWTGATGRGVSVGVIDTGADMTHPDVAPNLDVARSCSFIFSTTPTALPQEVGNGNCANKAAVQDVNGHGTHVSSEIAAPVNGIGIAGVAPEAKIVALHACTVVGFCFADSVAAALRYAGDQRLDVVNLSLFADPYLFYCGNDAQQRSILKSMTDAAKYAQQRGVLIVAAAGNEGLNLRHPPQFDTISPDYPPDSAEVRRVRNNCRVAPAEIPGVISVSAVGPIGIDGYTQWLASYSSIGGDVAGPGGDYFAATGTVQDAVIGAWSSTGMDGTWEVFDFLNDNGLPGLATLSGSARYIFINGTSMATPHVTGVAALVKQRHPDWSQGAVAAAVLRTASTLTCPPEWHPESADDSRACTGGSTNSFFGHGLVNAAAAAHS